MTSRKTLNAANLEALGAKRLAGLLIEISTGNAAAKRRLRLELAGTASAADAAGEIAKRLASIAKAKTFIDWRKIKPLAADLKAQHQAILAHVAPTDAREAFDLLWRLVATADRVFARTDDGSGRLMEAFRAATHDLGALAVSAGITLEPLAELAFEALRDDSYGQWEELVDILAGPLGTIGLEHLRARMADWQAQPAVLAPDRERRVLGWGSSGPVYADEVDADKRRRTAGLVLQQIADALGDVDGYIAQFGARARKAPVVAAQIARRLLDAGRVTEARDVMDAVEQRDRMPFEWEQAQVDTLEALGRADDAQAFRWERFSATLNPTHLKAYLRKLPDFDDFEAEQAAFALARNHPDVHAGLTFLIAWPALDQARRLVLDRKDELNGDRYELLGPAADALAEKHPLAATLMLRAMIDFTLGRARASRYGHAARHLAECSTLAKRIQAYGSIPDHHTYEERLRSAHGRKPAFWQEVG